LHVCTHRPHAKELERIRLPVENEAQRAATSQKRDTNTTSFTGYLVVGNELRNLPIGSTLDRARGVFSWQPGPGFIGEYRFVFIGKNSQGEFIRKNVVVTINPKN